MATAREDLELRVKAVNQTDRALKKVDKNLKRVAKSSGQTKRKMNELNTAEKRLKRTTEGFGSTLAGFVGFAAIGAGFASVIQKSAQFEQRLSDISTLLSGDSTDAINDMRQGILKLTKTLPKSADDLGASAYAILSAGITDTAQALAVLESSTRLAVAGLGTTEEATTLMTLAMNNFRNSGLNAEQMANILFKTVKNGITTVSQLAQSFGLVAPLAVEAGISLQELQATTAALTQVNKSASISQNAIKASLISLGKPTKDAIDLFNKLGVKTFPELIEQSGGYVSALKALEDASEGNEQLFARAIGSGEALAAVQALLGAQYKAVTDALGDMKSGTDALSEAVLKQISTFQSQFQILKNNVEATMISMGNEVIPSLVKAMNELTSQTDGASSAAQTFGKVLATVIEIASGLVKVIAFVGKTLGTVAASIVRFATGIGRLFVAINTLFVKAFTDPDGITQGFKRGLKDIQREGRDVIRTFEVGGDQIAKDWETLADGISGNFKRVRDDIFGKTNKSVSAKAIAEKKAIDQAFKDSARTPTRTFTSTGTSTEKEKKEMEKLEKSVKGVTASFRTLEMEAVESLEKLRTKHESEVAKMRSKIKGLKADLVDLNKEYKNNLQGIDDELGTAVIEQEKKISDLQKQIDDLLSEGTATDNVKKLRKELSQEQDALSEFLKGRTDLEDEVSEARRRSQLTDFERFIEDQKNRKEVLTAQFNEQKMQIEQSIVIQEQALEKEKAIFSEKQKKFQEVLESFKVMAGGMQTGFAVLQDKTQKAIDKIKQKLSELKSALRSAAKAGASIGVGGREAVAPQPAVAPVPVQTQSAISPTVNNNITVSGNFEDEESRSNLADSIALSITRSIQKQNLFSV